MPWDRELARLEREIRELSAGYDAFLYGSAARPPLETRHEVENAIRRLTAAEPESAADGYRLATLQTRYTTLCEHWERLQAEKEAGRRPGVYSRFTASAAKPSSRPNAAAAESVERSAGGSASGGESGGPPSAERDLFERYLAARKGHGEDVSGYEFSRFAHALEKERRKLRDRLGNVEVEFDIAERDGRVKLVARRKGASSS